MTALGIDCSNREPETWHDQRPSHPTQEEQDWATCTCEDKPEDERYLNINPNCPVHGNDPRSERERHMQSNDATWDELGAGFIEIEPNYDDPRSEEERDRKSEAEYVRTCGHPI
mgnify:CR=1 FL=1